MFKPLHDRVAIKRLSADEVSKGGILIPGNAQEKPEMGEVLSAGPGKMDAANSGNGFLPMTVKVGDRVLFGKYSGQTVKINGDEILVMREEDILGILD